MGSIFDFNDIENCEQVIRKTWYEFRRFLMMKLKKLKSRNF